jgi:hypothetical protein
MSKRGWLVAAIVCLLVIVVGVVAYTMWKPAPPPKRTTAERPVAELTKVEGVVDHRPAKTLTWRSAAVGMPLHHRDAVKTGKGASARVTFSRGGGTLEIDEQSLVVIEPPPELPPGGKPEPQQVARVERGTVRGVAKPGAPPVKVVTPDGKTTQIAAEGAEPVPFRVRVRKDGPLEVAVLKGRARVRSGKSEVVLKPKQVVDVTAKQISAPVDLLPYPTLTAPPVDAKVATGTEMELGWEPVEGATMYRVQVSHLLSFSVRLYDTTVVVPSFRLPAPKAMQTYVWRVASVDRAGRESEFGFARRFHVQTAVAPVPGKLLAPPDNAGLQYVDKPKPILFRWQGEAEGYELVVSRRPTLKGGVVIHRRCAETSLEVPGLRAGAYYWGVYARSKDKRRKPLFDDPYKLVIARRRPPYVKVPKTIKWK